MNKQTFQVFAFKAYNGGQPFFLFISFRSRISFEKEKINNKNQQQKRTKGIKTQK